jgi:hypothetical protein
VKIVIYYQIIVYHCTKWKNFIFWDDREHKLTSNFQCKNNPNDLSVFLNFFCTEWKNVNGMYLMIHHMKYFMRSGIIYYPDVITPHSKNNIPTVSSLTSSYDILFSRMYYKIFDLSYLWKLSVLTESFKLNFQVCTMSLLAY